MYALKSMRVPPVWWLRRQLCQRLPEDLVGKGVVPFVLLAQVVQDQQAQLLLRAELSELHLRRSFTKQH